MATSPDNTPLSAMLSEILPQPPPPTTTQYLALLRRKDNPLDPSSPCNDPRYELFAHLLLSMTPSEAFEKAFPSTAARLKKMSSGKTSSSNSYPKRLQYSSIAARNHISGRLKYLTSEMAGRVSITAELVLNRLRQIMDANLAHIVIKLRDKATGELSLDNLPLLTEDEQMALMAIECDKDGKWKIRLHPKGDATTLLARHLKLLDSEQPQQAKVTFNIQMGPKPQLASLREAEPQPQLEELPIDVETVPPVSTVSPVGDSVDTHTMVQYAHARDGEGDLPPLDFSTRLLEV